MTKDAAVEAHEIATEEALWLVCKTIDRNSTNVQILNIGAILNIGPRLAYIFKETASVPSKDVDSGHFVRMMYTSEDPEAAYYRVICDDWSQDMFFCQTLPEALECAHILETEDE